jgi:hypothetical protein
VVVAAGLPTLILPFWSDSAIFATVGKAIADGGFPTSMPGTRSRPRSI